MLMTSALMFVVSVYDKQEITASIGVNFGVWLKTERAVEEGCKRGRKGGREGD